jgi:hypothetical protein
MSAMAGWLARSAGLEVLQLFMDLVVLVVLGYDRGIEG